MIFVFCQIPRKITRALYDAMRDNVERVMEYPDDRVEELIDGFSYLDDECFVPYLLGDHADLEDALNAAVERNDHDECARLRDVISRDIAKAKRFAIRNAGLELLEKFILPLVPRESPDEAPRDFPEETEVRTPYSGAKWDMLVTGGHSDGGPPTEDALGLEFLDALHITRVDQHELDTSRIVAKWEAEYVAPNDCDLDDEVHAVASQAGSDVNNSGVHEQVLYLLQNGVTESYMDTLVGYKDRSEPEPKTFFLNERQELPTVPGKNS